MISRGIDKDGDWLFGKGANDYKVNKEALKQNIRTRLSSFNQDCFFSLSSGIDWFNLLGANNDLALNLSLSAEMLNTDGVLKINSLLINKSLDRNISFRYDIDTIYGRITGGLGIAPLANSIVTELGDSITTEEGFVITTE